MAYLFRSFKMVMASVITNVLPLCITSGLMGYFGIPLKPSTILVFSIAFGISVDNAIQFMAKYRHDLIQNNGKIKKSVFSALRETGISTFYTSVVLIFGFAIFTLSSFSGTIALGGLISCTLLFAMFANLLVLPALVLTFEKRKLKTRPYRRIIFYSCFYCFHSNSMVLKLRIFLFMRTKNSCKSFIFAFRL